MMEEEMGKDESFVGDIFVGISAAGGGKNKERERL